MSAPIPYPLLNGARQSFVSTEITFMQPGIGATQGGQSLNLALRGYTSAKYSRVRSRSKQWGNHPDPVSKTRGKNDYVSEFKYYLAEVRAIRQALQALAGAGYGDVFFNIQITHSENGFDTEVVDILGCTFDKDEVALAEGTEATMSDLDFSPLKIKWDGQDDCATPLQPTST